MPPKRSPALDRIDVKILVALQRDGRSTIHRLAETAALSPRACLERVRRLESSGIIIGYQAVVDVGLLSRPVTIFAELALEKQGRQERFEQRLAAVEEAVECWQISGPFDYLVRFVCADLARYESLTSRLIESPDLGIDRIVSHIALRPVRRFAGYPESLLRKAE